jgi:hypothetical protein
MFAFMAAVAAPASVLAEVGQQRKSTMRGATIAVDQFQKDLRGALGSMLGCGEDGPQADLDAIEKRLLPIWNSLPKKLFGRIERPSLRYMVHRYFMGTSSLVVRGFERSQPVNMSLVGSADGISVMVPAYVEAVLESQHAEVHGFDLKDAVHVVAMLKKLIADADGMVLEQAYADLGKSTQEPIGLHGLLDVLRNYLANWLMKDDPVALERFRRDPSKLDVEFPHWNRIVAFRDGVVQSFDFKRFRNAKGLTRSYTFSDVREIVSSITSSFAFYWDDLCIEMRDQLISMDTHHTGRVPLRMFYSKPLSLEWRFAESEDYLRELGALDETSRFHSGKEVIIPNYLSAASNCAIATEHYQLCCTDPCDAIFSELEVAIGGPAAPPEQIMELIGNMSNAHSRELDEEEAPQLRGSLQRQLEQIAATHPLGLIPVHGRLFAQWLHYVFPRECPFPHKTGSTSQVRPSGFTGGNYIVTEADRLKHVKQADGSSVPWENVKVDKESMQWMSQWSHEEELLTDYTMVLRSTSRVDYLAVVGVVLLIAILAAGVAGVGGKSGSMSSSMATRGKSNFV